MIAFIMVRMNKSKILSHLQFKQTGHRRSNLIFFIFEWVFYVFLMDMTHYIINKLTLCLMRYKDSKFACHIHVPRVAQSVQYSVEHQTFNLRVHESLCGRLHFFSPFSQWIYAKQNDFSGGKTAYINYSSQSTISWIVMKQYWYFSVLVDICWGLKM